MINPAFVKADLGKARTSLIPVGFRQCLREANESPSPNTVVLTDVYRIFEQYESEALPIDVSSHVVIQTAQYLAKLAGPSLGCTFLMGLAQVFTMGAKKYSVDNWMKCPYEARIRYVDAFYRHVYACEGGEELDEESGLHHIFHAGSCLAMLHGIIMIELRRRTLS